MHVGRKWAKMKWIGQYNVQKERNVLSDDADENVVVYRGKSRAAVETCGGIIQVIRKKSRCSSYSVPIKHPKYSNLRTLTLFKHSQCQRCMHFTVTTPVGRCGP
jgi:hypothetical protein